MEALFDFLHKILDPILSGVDPAVAIIVILSIALASLAWLVVVKTSSINFKNNTVADATQHEHSDTIYKLLHESYLKNEKNAEKILNLSIQVERLSNLIEDLERVHSDLPLPMWFKSVDLTMISANLAYEGVFLKPKGLSLDDYIGKTDYDVWPKDVADEFSKNDNKVIANKGFWVGQEDIPTPEGELVKWHIIKFSRMSGGKLLGVAGVAIPSGSSLKSIAKFIDYYSKEGTNVEVS